MNSFKPIGIAFAATVFLSLASCNTTPPIPDDTQVSSNVTQTKSSRKIYIKHYTNGGFQGQLHLIDWDLYDAIINYLLSNGQDPSPENIDRVYDAMKH